MEKKIVRVFLTDGSSKTLALDPTVKVQEAFDQVAEKINLREKEFFCLFEVAPTFVRKLDPTQDLIPVVNPHPAPVAGTRWDAAPHIELRKWNFNRPRETKLEDPVATHLFWIQAVYELCKDIFDPTEEQVLQLGGLHCQALFGDYQAARHQAGFLIAKLDEYVPKSMFARKSPADWETQILAQYQTCTGMQDTWAKVNYLERIRVVPYYGTIWFQPCACKEWEGEVYMGVGPEGLHIFRQATNELIATYPHSKIRRWVVVTNYFAFEVGRPPDVSTFTFASLEGKFLDQCLQQCVVEIMLARKLIQEKKEADERAAAEAGGGAAASPGTLDESVASSMVSLDESQASPAAPKKKRLKKVVTQVMEENAAVHGMEQAVKKKVKKKLKKKASSANLAADGSVLDASVADPNAVEGAEGTVVKKKVKKKVKKAAPAEPVYEAPAVDEWGNPVQ